MSNIKTPTVNERQDERLDALETAVADLVARLSQPADTSGLENVERTLSSRIDEITVNARGDFERREDETRAAEAERLEIRSAIEAVAKRVGEIEAHPISREGGYEVAGSTLDIPSRSFPGGFIQYMVETYHRSDLSRYLSERDAEARNG